MQANVIDGWYFVGNVILGSESLRYVINPRGAPTSTYTHDEAVAYCQMLVEAGVKPLYRN